VDYFQLTSDNYGETPHPRWQIGIEPKLESGEWWDIWAYNRGQLAGPPPHDFKISADGPRSELNIMYCGALVVSESVANAVDAVAHSEIQLIPVKIQTDPAEWRILNVLSIVDCIDYGRSVIEKTREVDVRNADEMVRLAPEKGDVHSTAARHQRRGARNCPSGM
jgi:hypothetical protein